MAYENITLDCNTIQFADATDEWWKDLTARYYPLSDASKFTGDFIFTSQYLDPQPASFSEWLFGDEQAGVKMVVTTTSWSLASFEIYNNGVKLGDSGLDEYLYAADREYKYNSDKISFGLACGVDRQTGKGSIFAVLKQDNNTNQRFVVVWLFNLNDYNRGVDNSTIYEILTDNEYIQSEWHAFSGVTGANGDFNFTMMNDEDIVVNASMPNTPPDKFSVFSSQTEIWHLLSGVPKGQQIYPIYAGKVDRMGIRYGLGVNDELIVTVSFFIMGTDTPFYTKSISQVDPKLTYLTFIVDNENGLAKFSFAEKTSNGGFDAYNVDYTEGGSATLYTWLHSHSNEPDINEPEPDGEADPWSDIGITGLTVPEASGIDTGFTSMYKVSDTELKHLAQFLWSDSFVDNVKKFFNDPREIIIGLSLMPISPDVGTGKNIKAGGIDTGISGLPLSSQYKLVPMGSVYVKEEKTAKFLNYPPNTKITVSLPYVGEHALDVNDVMGKTLTLTYLFDFLNGCCVAELKVGSGSKAHRYFYGGSCAVQIPTSAEDFGRQYSSILASGAAFGSILATPLTGGLSAPMAIGAAANILSNNMAMSPNVQYNSGGGSVNGFLSSQTAYLIIEQPNEKRAENQDNFIGRPSYMKKQLSSLSGFVKCYNVHLTGLPCTQAEKDEIEAYLKAGVLIETGSPAPTVTPATSGNIVIAFMKMRSENNVIGKTWDVGEQEVDIKKLEGKLIFDQSIMTPKLIVYGDMREYNYCYLDIFGRYYYITDIVVKSSLIMEITLKVDSLQSFKTQTLNCYALIERAQSSSAYNSYFNDGQYWTQQNKTVKFIPFLNSSNEELTIPRNSNSYILTIAGGD